MSGTRALWVGAKRTGRKLLGRPDWESFYGNGPRNRYNEMLRARYLGKEPVFDLAGLEAGGAPGDSTDGPSLLPAFTDDGGHLNERGRKEIARHLLVFLAKEADAREPAAPGGRTAAVTERQVPGAR